jgi:PAS domain S-box-containing protein
VIASPLNRQRDLVELALLTVLLIGWAFSSLVGFEHPGPMHIGAFVVLISWPTITAALIWRQLRARQATRIWQANRRLSAIAESCQEMLWETSGGVITYVSPSVTDYLGYQPEELVGQPAPILFPDFERPRAANLARNCFLAACGWRDEEYTYVTRNGELRDFITSGLAQTDVNGNVVGFAGSMRVMGTLSASGQFAQERHDIQQIIDGEQMQTVFQPILGISSGVIIGAEALTRFTTSDPAMATPDKWFAAAVRVGLGTELELLAVARALDAARALPSSLFLTVNVSPATLLGGRLSQVVERSGWDYARLVVEITEHICIEDYELLSARMKPLRKQGLRMAVDDAGAGYASFRHILALTPDHIKLDRGLITGIDTDPGRRALVKAGTAFAGDIGATVVAEGIETAAELRAAELLGVQSAQGYFIGRPAPVSDWPEQHLRMSPELVGAPYQTPATTA